MSENTNIKLQTVIEVSEKILNIKPARLYELIRQRKFPNGVVIKLGERQLRINVQKLNEWIDKGGSCVTEINVGGES